MTAFSALAAKLPVSSRRHAVQPARRRRKSSGAGARDLSIDVLRGIAIVLMIGDHLALMFGGVEADAYRMTLGRVAMPLFFVIAGHLVGTRLSVRHAYVLAVGAALPLVVPWIDNPNVLVLYVVGAAVIVVARQYPDRLRWLLVAGSLTLAANGYVAGNSAGYYDPAATLGLMALGSLAPRSLFHLRWVSLVAFRGTNRQLRFTRRLAQIGSAPLRWYVGHLVLLEALRPVLVGEL